MILIYSHLRYIGYRNEEHVVYSNKLTKDMYKIIYFF